MPRPGAPGTIRGEAARRGISEYQVRKERELVKAVAERRRPDYYKAAGKGSAERQRDLRHLNKVLQIGYKKGSSSYEPIWKATRKTYGIIGREETERLLVLQGQATSHYLRGVHFWIDMKELRRAYPDVPQEMFWYHGALG